MSSMPSGGASPEIRQNYSGGLIVFNAIATHAGLSVLLARKKKRCICRIVATKIKVLESLVIQYHLGFDNGSPLHSAVDNNKIQCLTEKADC